jgi:hypothetical protein
MIIEQYIDPAGFIRIIWQMANGDHLSTKWKVQPTNQQLLDKENQYLDIIEYKDTRELNISIVTEAETVKSIVKRLRDNPNTTFNQYNNYLSGLLFSEAIVIKFFLFAVAKAISAEKGINIDGVSEAALFANVKLFLVDTPIKKLKRLLLVEFDD